MTKLALLLTVLLLLGAGRLGAAQAPAPRRPDSAAVVIRVNLLGYRPGLPKGAVWARRGGSAGGRAPREFTLRRWPGGRVVWRGRAGRPRGAYGPFGQTCRLDFSGFNRPGRYWLQTADGAQSPPFRLGAGVYDGAADLCLRYLRQQRNGFNPWLRDSCHTHDGYLLDGPVPDSTRVRVVGGWHDAADYLQYVTTSANATYHLLAAARDFPGEFGDGYGAGGLPGANGRADVLDEARWGLDWLLQMHPRPDWLFNQVADDRDHAGLRLPKEDRLYGRGFERPVYFATGRPQGRLGYQNRATGVASTAGKVSSALALGARLLAPRAPAYAARLDARARSAYQLGLARPGNCQTAPGRAPYFYEEDNYADDMELAAAELARSERQAGRPGAAARLGRAARAWARQEPVTPWLGQDTARHYQWYPFVNLGHAALAAGAAGAAGRAEALAYYRRGLARVWQRARANAFYRGVPFIWCSNNLTVACALQGYWYRQASRDRRYLALEQANFDWLLGLNPWGVSFGCGLGGAGAAAAGPRDPHSAFAHLRHDPLTGALVDGPVKGSIFRGLRGLTLTHPDAYAPFQSDLAVYHDDFGDYSTNEPTLDGTATLVYLLAARAAEGRPRARPRRRATVRPPQRRPVRARPAARPGGLGYRHGAVVRGDSTRRRLALVFTGDEFADGGPTIERALRRHRARASFFLTGRFLRRPEFAPLVRRLARAGHYLGPHSDQHLLYCAWQRRDSLLVSRATFARDLQANLQALRAVAGPAAGGRGPGQRWLLPPYEWYNDTIAAWARAAGWPLVCYTPGLRTAADYTTPADPNYLPSDAIVQALAAYEARRPAGLNGLLLLVHLGAAPARPDKLYRELDRLLAGWRRRGYAFVTVPELLGKQ